MRAGRLRFRVDLYRPPTAEGRNVYGEPTNPMERVASEMPDGKWWADISPTSATETESGGQVRASVAHEIRMRHQPTLRINPKWEVRYAGRVFRIDGVINVDERNHEALLSATEMVGQFPSV